MRYGISTFAGQLRHFARSVDIVDDQIFDRVRELIYRYVRNELGASYFELMREEAIDTEPGLKMFWSSNEKDHFWRIQKTDGSFCNLVTMAYGKEQPLWIVGADKKPLTEAEGLEDEWSRNAELAPYEPMIDEGVRTLIVLPLRRRRLMGVYYFESCAHIGITEVAKKELQLLAEAIAILLELYDTNRSQSNMTSSAISELQESLESAKFPKLTKPHFFVAFSKRADESVTTVITELLYELSDKLDFTDWTRMTDAGNISAHIAREITSSRFGICYLSEPNPNEGDMKYVDNPNVVFEAGMLHARTAAEESAEAGEPAGWIPIREVASAAAPFDFAAERTVLVPRLGNGEVNESKLRQALSERVNRLLGEE